MSADGPPAKKAKMTSTSAVLYFDGGSRGNGSRGAVAGAGCVLLMDDVVRYEGSFYLGHATNNEAEYAALKSALDAARIAGIKRVVCRGDSDLVVQQMKGTFRVKAKNLQTLNVECHRLARTFEHVEYEHVYREHNKKADALANRAMDTKQDYEWAK